MALLRYLTFFIFSLLIHSLVFSSTPKNEISYALATEQQNKIAIQLVATKKVEKPSKKEPEEAQKTALKTTKTPPKNDAEKTKNRSKKDNNEVVKKELISTKKVAKKVAKKTPQEKPKKQANNTQAVAKTEDKKQPTEQPNKHEKVAQSLPKTEPTTEAQSVNKSKKAAPKMVKKVTFSARPAPIDYPHSAKRRNIEGQVLVEVWLDKQGKQIKQQIINSSGHSVLDDAALKGISQWQFSRQQDGGQAIAYRVQVPINFGLN